MSIALYGIYQARAIELHEPSKYMKIGFSKTAVAVLLLALLASGVVSGYQLGPLVMGTHKHSTYATESNPDKVSQSSVSQTNTGPTSQTSAPEQTSSSSPTTSTSTEPTTPLLAKVAQDRINNNVPLQTISPHLENDTNSPSRPLNNPSANTPPANNPPSTNPPPSTPPQNSGGLLSDLLNGILGSIL